MQGCCVGARIGVRSRWCMERVTVSTKSTRVGNAMRHGCRRPMPKIEGGSPPPTVVACETEEPFWFFFFLMQFAQ